MKKFIFLVLTLIFIFTLAACGSDTPATVSDTDNSAEQTTDEQDGNDQSKLKATKYTDMMMSNKYYMEYTSYGMDLVIKNKTAADGDNYDTITEMMGITTHTLILDNVMYNIDDLNKTYTEFAINDTEVEEEEPTELDFDYDAIKYQSSGNGPIPGFEEVDTNSYEYEEYTTEIEEEGTIQTFTMRYYFNGNELYAIYIDMMDSPMIMAITTMSSDIPAGMLQLPEGYSKVEATNFDINDYDLEDFDLEDYDIPELE